MILPSQACTRARALVAQNAPESISEHLKLNFFPGGACPQTPLATARFARCHMVWSTSDSKKNPPCKNSAYGPGLVSHEGMHRTSKPFVVTTCLVVTICDVLHQEGKQLNIVCIDLQKLLAVSWWIGGCINSPPDALPMTSGCSHGIGPRLCPLDWHVAAKYGKKTFTAYTGKTILLSIRKFYFFQDIFVAH